MKEIITTILALILLLCGLDVLQSHTKSEFKEVCYKLNGTVVFDGQQYQCLSTSPSTNLK